jgi:hypothetical protein
MPHRGTARPAARTAAAPVARVSSGWTTWSEATRSRPRTASPSSRSGSPGARTRSASAGSLGNRKRTALGNRFGAPPPPDIPPEERRAAPCGPNVGGPFDGRTVRRALEGGNWPRVTSRHGRMTTNSGGHPDPARPHHTPRPRTSRHPCPAPGSEAAAFRSSVRPSVDRGRTQTRTPRRTRRWPGGSPGGCAVPAGDRRRSRRW